MAPDYDPKAWKEYSFADDNIRFRFPVQPKRVESTTGAEKYPSGSYTRESFMYFDLTVTTFPPGFGAGVSEKAMLDGGVDGLLNGIKAREPKILKQEDVSVDGYAGRFVKVETKDGFVLRLKFFFAEGKLYIAQAISKKGDRHGVNWENDFEIPAMAFLDSLHLIKTK